ncbi:MAG: hypothetical protein LAO79_12515 [Acidobacteriia bacterium]|nr:hypothetical protein [Terriglobia bacterium]
MNRNILLMSLALFACGTAGAQSPTSIRIGTSFTSLSGSNPIFIVDGTSYTSPQTFVWPNGSKHIVQFPFSTDQGGSSFDYQNASSDSIHYFFNGWIPNNQVTLTPNASAVQTITADPSLTSLIAQVTAQYRVHLVLPNGGTTINNPNCTGAPFDAPTDATRQGIMYFQGVCYGDTTTGATDPFVPAGSYTINAFPYPGWVFYSWQIGNNPPSYLSTVTVAGPTQIIALFSVAKRVNFVTNPPGLQILVDGSLVNTTTTSDGTGNCTPDYTRMPPNAPPGFAPLCAGQFDFLPGSKHTLGSPVSQLDKIGRYWVFQQFSNGLGQNSTYVVSTNTSAPDTVTVGYVPGIRAVVLTNPGKMKVMIDGRDNWPAYTFIWGQGETHHIAAETPQSDPRGRVYNFAGWSDTGMADTGHDLVVGTSDIAVTASYAILNQIRIGSSPATMNFTVDGAGCPSPCVLNKVSTATSQIAAPTQVSAGAGSRYDFVSWSDGNTSPTRTVNFTQDTLALTANYQMSYQLTNVVNPSKAGSFTTSPASPDGFYPNGTQVTVATTANGGFKFAHWEGDLTGSYAPGLLTMSTPHTVQADFATVPFIPPAGIQSVTGPTPDGSVAPGSIISIYGQNLAPAMQVGPSNPLAQTLGGVTVTIGDFLLPLVFVSPDQISAQVPWELADGTFALVVHNAGLPDVPGSVTISRDAPGVFTQVNDQQLPLILALHADGTVVNFQSPASLGEQITIYGTGFGPFDKLQVDGFPTAAIDNQSLVDPVAVNTDTASLKPDWTGAAAGMVGVNILKLTITNDMPASSNVNITVQVNGKSSSQVVLPVQ